MTEIASPFGDIRLLVMIAVSALAFITVIGLGLTLIRRDPLGDRVKAVVEHRDELNQEQKRRLDERRKRRDVRRMTLMTKLTERLKLQGKTTSVALRLKLAKAGWRGRVPIVIYVLMRVASPIIFSLLAALLLFGARKSGMDTSTKLLLTAGVGALGYFAPAVVVANAIQRRKKELLLSFPDALDLLIICVEAGLSIDAAFDRVTKEMGDSLPILSEEMGLASAEMAFLGSRRDALVNLAQRVDLPDYKSLATALIQSEKYGTSMSDTLRVLANENREARKTRATEKASRLPAILTVPMILFIFPALFVVLMGPAVIQTIRTLF